MSLRFDFPGFGRWMLMESSESGSNASSPSGCHGDPGKTERCLCMDGPRERLEHIGLSFLSDAELLALIVRTGTRDADAMMLSRSLLSDVGGLVGLSEISLRELSAHRGMGPAKSASVLASRELGRRLAESRLERGARIRSADDVYGHFVQRMRWRQQEEFAVLLLDGRNQVIRESVISKGTLNASLVHPREVFRSAVREAAASLVLVHNHPSGDPAPSGEDLRVTRRLVEAGQVVGIRVLDHVVIADQGYYSFREEGELPDFNPSN